MKNHSKLHTFIIGAGVGGITSALLGALRSEKITLLESHDKIGGCASYFRRGQFVFDAGATTLSGVGQEEPLGILFKMLGNSPELVAADPGITFHLSSGKIIRYHRDFEKWMTELETNFPGKNHRPFWKLVRKTNTKSWKLLRDVDIFNLASIIKHPTYITLVPGLLVSTEQVLKSHGLDDKEYLELINGIMIISAQAHSENIPFLVGAMALSYPAETYAIKGGMKGLMDFFESELKRLGVEVRKKTRVTRFSHNQILLSSGEIISCDRVIANLPVWNIAEMTDSELLKKEAVKRPGAWGAFTLYFGVKGNFKEMYQQVHLNHPDIKNYFVSFSIPGDELRAPEGYQAVSISTHVMAEEEIRKDYLTEIIMFDFRNRFHIEEIKFLTAGTPKTFERYTGRKHGFVGGLPFLFGKNPFEMLKTNTGLKEVYRVGDTVFPGQGLCGVTAGSLQLHKHLKKEL